MTILPRVSSTIAVQKLMPPTGLNMTVFGAATAMNWRPATKCRGSEAVATPIVPTIRPSVKSGEVKSPL
jgi:hypothetical protein